MVFFDPTEINATDGSLEKNCFGFITPIIIYKSRLQSQRSLYYFNPEVRASNILCIKYDRGTTRTYIYIQRQ